MASFTIRPMRVFRNYYACEACTDVGCEWDDILLTRGPSFCPCCDNEVDPYSSDELIEQGVFDAEDA